MKRRDKDVTSSTLEMAYHYLNMKYLIFPAILILHSIANLYVNQFPYLDETSNNLAQVFMKLCNKNLG